MQKIARKMFVELKNHLKNKEISLIVGPRQAGKTTLMLDLKDYLEQTNQKTLFLNLDYELDKIFFESQDKLLAKIKLEFGNESGYIFIDEIQRKENAGLFLKGIYDLNLPYKFIVSGSGSLELKEKINESLAGRKRMFELGTVSFVEFVDFKTNYKYSRNIAEFFKLEEEKTVLFLNEYLNFGGYPRVVLEESGSEKIKIMNEIFRSYIEKDIAYLLQIDKTNDFNMLIKLLSNQSGQLITYSKIARDVGVSVQTIKKYIWYAEKTFIIKLLQPFYRNRLKEITKSPVAYFYDLGMRNFSLGLFGNLNQPSEIGFVFQNFIVNELSRLIQNSSKNLCFWRTIENAEVDIVVSDGINILPVEIKYSRLKETKITRSLHNFINKYQPSDAQVVNLSLDAEIKIGKTNVRFIPFYGLLK